MDNDFSFSAAVNKVLSANKKLSKSKLENELNNYI